MEIDISYIQSTIGDVIAEAMRETIRAAPVDPIDYLAKWLLHYRDVQDNVAQFGDDQKQLITDKGQYFEELKAEKARIDEERRRKEEEEEAQRKAQEEKMKEEARKRALAEEEEEMKEEPQEES